MPFERYTSTRITENAKIMHLDHWDVSVKLVIWHVYFFPNSVAELLILQGLISCVPLNINMSPLRWCSDDGHILCSMLYKLSLWYRSKSNCPAAGSSLSSEPSRFFECCRKCPNHRGFFECCRKSVQLRMRKCCLTTTTDEAPNNGLNWSARNTKCTF